jgi:NADH-quinone oxidoreductase subunit N
MWTPDAYEGAPTPVTAFMSVGVKAAGFAVLGRVALGAFGDLYGDWVWLLAGLSALTMTVGNLAALRQTNLKRMLAYSSIAHAGYILMGLTAGNATGVSAVLFYLFVYAFMNAAAFAVLIAVDGAAGSGRGSETLEGMAGLGRRQPLLAAAMAVVMLSLAGVPPMAGFFAKLWIFGAAVQADLIWLVVFGVINSVVSAYYYLRVVAAMYLQKAEPVTPDAMPVHLGLWLGLGIASVAIIVLGVWPTPLWELARAALLAWQGM